MIAQEPGLAMKKKKEIDLAKNRGKKFFGDVPPMTQDQLLMFAMGLNMPGQLADKKEASDLTGLISKQDLSDQT